MFGGKGVVLYRIGGTVRHSVGVLGGSFDPPHAGHLAISLVALRRLRLDRVVWLLSPGNPLKTHKPASLQRRAAAARTLFDGHPKLGVSTIEAQLGTRYTVDTVHALTRLSPQTDFVWLMGADNLVQFHRWKDWPQIMESLPVAVFARPGQQVRAGLSPAARRFARYRLPPEAAALLPQREPPCWTLIRHPMSPASSTALRRAGAW